MSSQLAHLTHSVSVCKLREGRVTPVSLATVPTVHSRCSINSEQMLARGERHLNLPLPARQLRALPGEAKAPEPAEEPSPELGWGQGSAHPRDFGESLPTWKTRVWSSMVLNGPYSDKRPGPTQTESQWLHPTPAVG